MKKDLTFGEALEALKLGAKCARKGWNGKGMYIYLDTFISINEELREVTYGYEPCFVMFTADKDFQPGWLASQADMLACDWEVLA